MSFPGKITDYTTPRRSLMSCRRNLFSGFSPNSSSPLPVPFFSSPGSSGHSGKSVEKAPKTQEIPVKFRQEMPKRLQPPPPPAIPENPVSPIKTETFYGKSPAAAPPLRRSMRIILSKPGKTNSKPVKPKSGKYTKRRIWHMSPRQSNRKTRVNKKAVIPYDVNKTK